MEKETKLKVGDRVKVISALPLSEANVVKVRIGTRGTVKEIRETRAGVEFDKYINGHDGRWGGKNGYCWYLLYDCLEKIKEDEGRGHEKTESCIQGQTPGNE